VADIRLSDDLNYDMLFKNLPAPCLVLDRNMHIITATQKYLETVQRPLAEIVGRYAFDVFPESGERLKLFKDAVSLALAGEENTLVEVPYAVPATAPDGTQTMREIWWTCHHKPVFDANGKVLCVIQNAQDVTQQVKAEKLKDAIAAELQHRVGNILGLVSVIARRTAGTSENLTDFLKKFDGRVQALSRTHSYLTGTNWDRMTIEKIVSRQLADYFELDGEQITLVGGDIALNPAEAQILTLAIHELTTNSVKYGALKTPQGRLNVAWRRVGPSGYDLEWREDGIEAVVPKRGQKGFGSLILDEIVPAQLQAKSQRDLGASSFHYHLSVPERAIPA
jgi:two-component sensor histidine kinase